MSTIAIYGMPDMPDVNEIAGDFCVIPSTSRDRALHTVNWFLTGDRTLSHYSLGLKVQDLQKLNHEK